MKLEKKLCEELTGLSKTANKDILKLERSFRDRLVYYYGYSRLREICNTTSIVEPNKSIEELLNELNELVGLDKVKKQVNDLIAFQTVRQKREAVGLNAQKTTLHMAFTGNPGTGKTTVARVVSGLYKQLGLLSKGHFIEVSRTDLIAGYQGQTAHKVKEVINKARGGVLFIDEAYSITENDHTDSYGRECLTELTKALEDYRDDLVVIVAGYTEPMKKFFESNPGLRSRFNIFIEFDDYQEKELIEMFGSICEKNSYSLSPGAEEVIKKIIQECVSKKDDKFANGRLVRNLFERVTMNHARRVFSMEAPSETDLKELIESDINYEYEEV
jgi:SpoVK/Ycf46/Vps4 family AAA+-type ATPase